MLTDILSTVCNLVVKSVNKLLPYYSSSLSAVVTVIVIVQT